jgi:hypothetical protein
MKIKNRINNDTTQEENLYSRTFTDHGHWMEKVTPSEWQNPDKDLRINPSAKSI